MCLTCHSRLTSRNTINIDTIFEVGMIATIKEVISRKRSLHKLTFDNSYRSRSVNPQGLGVWSNCVKEEMGKRSHLCVLSRTRSALEVGYCTLNL